MTNNRKIAISIFKELQKAELVPADISFGNCYFIFEKGEDGVVHFHIKGIKGWLFAMWINTSTEDKAVQFFAQYEDFIDKFKPSASTFVVNVSRDTLKRVASKRLDTSWAYFDIIEMVKHIRYNPKLAFVQDGTFSFYITEPYLKKYYREKKYQYTHKIDKFRKRITDDLFPYCVNTISALIVKSWHEEIINDIKVIDQNKGGFICSPRWDVTFYYNKVSDKRHIQAAVMDKVIAKINKYRLLFTKVNTCFSDLVIKEDGSYERW